MKKGFIKRLIANQYTLLDLDSGEEVIALARGKFRRMHVGENSSFNKQITKRSKIEQKHMVLSPKVGDFVRYDDAEDQVLITEIMPRHNDLERPDVANVDQVLLVFSVIKPEFSFRLLDKFLIILNQQNLNPVLVISKIDLIDKTQLISIQNDLEYYRKTGYEIYYVNSKQKIGIDVLEHVFKDKITVLAGQTGVGKSTLLNALMPELKLKTQEISKALGRGKHTTRHTELYTFNGGYIVDTPGFSKIDFTIFHADELRSYYPDFEKLSASCKFGSKCMHLKEPGCAVKAAVSSQEMPSSRLENYQAFIDEIKNQKPVY